MRRNGNKSQRKIYGRNVKGRVKEAERDSDREILTKAS